MGIFTALGSIYYFNSLGEGFTESEILFVIRSGSSSMFRGSLSKLGLCFFILGTLWYCYWGGYPSASNMSSVEGINVCKTGYAYIRELLALSPCLFFLIP